MNFTGKQQLKVLKTIWMGLQIVLAASLLRLWTIFQQFKTFLVKKILDNKIQMGMFFLTKFHKTLFKMGYKNYKGGKLPLN